MKSPTNFIRFGSLILLSTFLLLLHPDLFSQSVRGKKSYWTDWISEEEGRITARPGYYLAGYRCSDKYCDNRQLMFVSYDGFDRSDGGSTNRSWVRAISEERSRNFFQAPEGTLISGLGCSGKYCDNVQLQVAGNRTANLFVDKSRQRWSRWISEERGMNEYIAEDGYFIIGYECRGKYCDDRRFLVAPLDIVEISDEPYWTNWVSEEEGEVLAKPGFYLAGYRCSGKYGDNQKLYFKSFESFDRTANGSTYRRWVKSISEEPPSDRYLASQGFLMTGLRCSGRYCDNINLQVARNRRADLSVDRTRQYWTHWISEESDWNEFIAPEGHFIVGYECKGSYCDDRRFLVAPINIYPDRTSPYFNDLDITFNETFALRMKDQGFIKCGSGSYSNRLVFSYITAFEWQFRTIRNQGGSVETGRALALYNVHNNSFLVFRSLPGMIDLDWQRNDNRPVPLNWVVEGADNSALWLKNVTLGESKQYPYLVYGNQYFGMDLAWGRKPLEANMEIIEESATMKNGRIVPFGGTWAFKNTGTDELKWGEFEKAFDLEWYDYFDPITYGVYLAAFDVMADGGNCFGLCLAANYTASRLVCKFPFHEEEIREPIGFRYVDNGPHNEESWKKLEKSINVFHWKQLSKEFLNRWIDGLTVSPYTTARRIENDLRNNRTGMLCVYDGFSKAHVIIPWKVERKAGQIRIHVYDPNDPYYNQPFDLRDTLKENLHPQVIVTSSGFSYAFDSADTWDDALSYVRYDYNQEYDDLMNSVWDLGYIIISRAGEADQISDERNRKLFKTNRPSGFKDIDFSLASGLGRELLRVTQFSSSHESSGAWSTEKHSGKGVAGIVEKMLGKYREMIDGGAQIYLIRNTELNNLKATISLGDAEEPLWIGIGNAKESMEFKFDRTTGRNLRPEVMITNPQDLSMGITLSNQADKRLNMQITYSRKVEATKELEIQSVKVPLQAEKTEISLSTAQHLQIRADHLEGRRLINTTSRLNMKGTEKRNLRRLILVPKN